VFGVGAVYFFMQPRALNEPAFVGMQVQGMSNEIGVIAKSGVLAPESSGDQIDLCYLNTVFELYSGYHLGQVIEAA